MKTNLQNDAFVSLKSLLKSTEGKRYWRSVEEFYEREESQQSLQDEFPEGADDPPDGVSRRRFLQLAAASFGLAGMVGCTRQPTEKILPYVDPPENAVPGRPLFFATAVPFAGIGQGVIVESHLGRPTKIEGNPDHPSSLGATSVHSQASVLDLYDPDRATTIKHLGQEQSWEDFLHAFRFAFSPILEKRGAGLRILTDTITSPTLGAQLQKVLAALPEAKWYQYDPAGSHSAFAGAQIAFGRPINTYYKLDQANVVAAIDSDFLVCGHGSTRYAHDFAERRTRGQHTDMNRLYVIESTMTATGGKADHRLSLRYGEIDSATRKLAAFVGVQGVTAPAVSSHDAWIQALAEDLKVQRGSSVVIPGSHQSPAVHALIHAINIALGNVGKTVIYTDPLEVEPTDQVASLQQLTSDMKAGKVEMALLFGGNTVFNAPVDLDFVSALQKVKTSIRVGLYEDETSSLCHWHIPESHFLEEWGDIRSFDGTITIMQPLIQPLYDSRSYLQILDLMLNPPGRTSYEIVQAFWKEKSGAAGDFEGWWRKSVHDGLIGGSALPPITPALRADWGSLAKSQTVQGIEIVFRPDPYLYDGRFANNTWLQELPQPMTKLTWDNAVYLSPATAKRLGLVNQNYVELSYRGQSVEGGVWVLPGHPDESVTVHLGWGRWRSGRAGNGAGFDTYKLRRSDSLWSGFGVQIRKLDKAFQLATTQMHQAMEGRDLIISDTLDRYKREPEFVKEKSKEPPKAFSLYPKWSYTGNAWGMSIDLNRCVNCSACVVACQAENNIPVVGKEQVLARRAMHWLRIDAYFEGDLNHPRAHYQPVPCMQCENAPCELVCPVQATNHSSDGLNDMVYNRCVGTRYCSNNCPYKVRRFNFLLYQDWVTESIKLQRNPDVSVRSRGVMEKCTYCVQRIREADIRARIENRPIRDGEIQTACQQSCPTHAIVFGDINQPDSQVAKLKAEKLDYALLADLNTRPRTTYLAELLNPNPEMKGTSQS